MIRKVKGFHYIEWVERTWWNDDWDGGQKYPTTKTGNLVFDYIKSLYLLRYFFLTTKQNRGRKLQRKKLLNWLLREFFSFSSFFFLLRGAAANKNNETKESGLNYKLRYKYREKYYNLYIYASRLHIRIDSGVKVNPDIYEFLEGHSKIFYYSLELVWKGEISDIRK